MQRHVCVTFLVLAGTMLLGAQTSVQRLQDVKTIYVLPMDAHNAEMANLITAKLISHLAKCRSISIVESEDNADAILTGSGLVRSTSNAYGHPGFHVSGAMRLDNKDGVVLWADDVSSGRFARSATS